MEERVDAASIMAGAWREAPLVCSSVTGEELTNFYLSSFERKDSLFLSVRRGPMLNVVCRMCVCVCVLCFYHFFLQQKV